MEISFFFKTLCFRKISTLFSPKVQSLIFPLLLLYFSLLKLEIKLYVYISEYISLESRRRFDFRNWLNRLSVVYWARVIQREFSFIHSVWWAFGISAFFVFLCLLSHLFTEHSFHAHRGYPGLHECIRNDRKKNWREREKR